MKESTKIMLQGAIGLFVVWVVVFVFISLAIDRFSQSDVGVKLDKKFENWLEEK